VAQELEIYEHLSNKVVRGVHGRNVQLLLAQFTHQGPTGVHQCLVFDPITESVEILEGHFPDPSSPIMEERQPCQVRFPLSISKAVLRETLRGLRHLHRKQVVHGDLHSGKLFIASMGLEVAKEYAIRALEDRYIVRSSSDDGSQDVLIEHPLREFVNLNRPLHVKIGGFGCGK
jgi:hypothetical protein